MPTDHFVSDRQSPRNKVIMPITLVADPKGEGALVPASTLDVSSRGLRIQAHVRLSVGELIHVQFEKQSTDLRQYRVVWSKAGGGLWPGQAGLRSLKPIRKARAGRLTL